MNQKWENLNMLKWRLRAAAFVVALAAPLVGWAQNTIQAITSSQQGGSEVVRIELAEPLAALPTGFTVQAPPRVALDLPGIGNGLGRSTVDINQGNLRSVSVAQAGDRTRLVFNLKQASNYRAELQGKVLVVVLEGSGATATAGATSPTGEPVHFAASQNRDQLPLKDIDFRRGPDGAGRVVVGLANTQVGVDIRQQGQSLVVEFLRSTLPDALRRRLDVTDFGTPVQTVSTTQSRRPRAPGRRAARLVGAQRLPDRQPVRARSPAAEGRSEQADARARLRRREAVAELPEHRGSRAAAGDRRLHQLQRRHQRHRHRQRDAAPEGRAVGSGARHHPAEPRAWACASRATCLWIAPKDELAAKEKLDLESRKQITDLEPVRTQSFQLNYTKAEDVAKGITGQARQGGGELRQSQPHPEPAWQRDLRDPDQPVVRHRHPVEAGGSAGADRQDRHPGAAGA